MNSVHDMGGMHGLGPLVRHANEPVFHHPWEGRVHGLNAAISAWRKWNLDAFRQALESIPGADYLRMTYYERWLCAVTKLSVDAGLVSREEVASGRPADGQTRSIPPLRPEMILPGFRAGAPKSRPVDATPRFSLGDRVRARVINPPTHTRLPRYLRGHEGEIAAHHGAHVFPDSNALFQGQNPQHLYTVQFRATDLWGPDANPRDTVRADLWEPYLDHA